MEADAVVEPEAVWLQQDDTTVSKLKREPEAEVLTEDIPGCDRFTFAPGYIYQVSQTECVPVPVTFPCMKREVITPDVNHVDAMNEAILSADVRGEGNKKLNSDIDIEEVCLLEENSECSGSAEEMNSEVTVTPESMWLVEDEGMSQALVENEGMVSSADCEKINEELKTEIDIEENSILGDCSEFIQSCKVAVHTNVLENEGVSISSIDKLQTVLQYKELVTVSVDKKQERKIGTKNKSGKVHRSFSKCALMSETQYKCDICGKCLKTNSNIVSHINSHILAKPFQCEVRNKCFTRSGNFKKHIRTHTSEKPFQCKECSKCFTVARNLKNHMRLHTGDESFKCKECCKCFTQSVHLKDHMRLHTGEKPFKCVECSKCFTQSSILKRHVRTHTGEKPFKCKECIKCFTESYSLKKHVMTHTG